MPFDRRQSGNFLLQALLAIALIVAFIPVFTQKLARRESDQQMYAITTQVNVAQTAARIYLRENLASLNYQKTILTGNHFGDTLEPYGLPLGFSPHTSLGQEISLIIDKTTDGTIAYLELSGGKLSGLQRAELVRRLGFYASTENDFVYLVVPLDENYSDLVRRRDKDPDTNGFLSDLDMGGFGVENASGANARDGEFGSLQVATMSIFGTEDGRKIRSKVENLSTTKAVFQTTTGEAALTLTRGNLAIGAGTTRTISKFGDGTNLTAVDAGVYDFSMTAGHTNFSGPSKWTVGGNVITDRVVFTVERLEVTSFINTARGQDVYVDYDTLDYSARSGIDVDTMHAANVTLRDQTSHSLLNGGTGAVLLDIRPAGTSVLPDVLSDDIDNGTFVIISDPADDTNRTVDCKSVIAALDGTYNQKSVSQNLICQYVFWQRLEKRIDIKQCLLDGKSDCK